MADTQNSGEALRAEIDTLRAQLEKVVKSLEDKKSDLASDLADKLSKEFEHYRDAASDRARKLYDAGQSGMDEVGEHVRRNPVASLLIAFGVGCVFSCLMRHLR